jgi:putative phosphoribosyl transferase
VNGPQTGMPSFDVTVATGAVRLPGTLSVPPGAGHLFQERGALEAVARLASAWFSRHLTPRAPGPGA